MTLNFMHTDKHKKICSKTLKNHTKFARLTLVFGLVVLEFVFSVELFAAILTLVIPDAAPGRNFVLTPPM